MAFARINAWDLPTEDESPSEGATDIGSRERSFEGSFLSDRRADKDNWTLTTSLQTELVSKAIEGAARGFGDVFPFDWQNNFNTTEDFFSTKGVGRDLTTGQSGGLRYGVAADRDLIVEHPGDVPATKYGSGALTNEDGTTNVFTTNVRTGTEALGTTAGFSVIAGASLISELSNRRVAGTRSLRVTVAAAFDGVRVDQAASAATLYVVSGYIKADAASSIDFNVGDDISFPQAGQTVTTAVGQWVHIQIAFTTSGGATSLRLEIENTTTTANFNVDLLQMEISTVSPNLATTWVDGTRTGTGFVRFLNVLKGFEDYTINLWAKLPSATTAADQELLRVTTEGVSINQGLALIRPSGTSDIRFSTLAAPDTTFDDLDFTTSAYDGTWHLFSFVIRQEPEVPEVKKAIYVDGVLVASNSPTNVPRWKDFPASLVTDDALIEEVWFDVGGTLPSDNLKFGSIDDLSALPWAAPVSQILAWFNMGIAMSPLPRVYLDGDIVPNPPLTLLVDGTKEDKSFKLGVPDTNGPRANLSQLELSFEEV